MLADDRPPRGLVMRSCRWVGKILFCAAACHKATSHSPHLHLQTPRPRYRLITAEINTAHDMLSQDARKLTDSGIFVSEVPAIERLVPWRGWLRGVEALFPVLGIDDFPGDLRVAGNCWRRVRISAGAVDLQFSQDRL